MAKCMCKLFSADQSIEGLIELEQASETSPTVLRGEVTGLAPGKHALAICVSGDLSNCPASLGAHFNPTGSNHGAPTDAVRHVGSLGNIVADADGKAKIDLSDNLVKLIGPQSIIGRSISVAAGEDDFGKGGHEQSLINGNSGPAVAWGVVGIRI